MNDNSIVVWTDWQTKAGASVIVPIRIDVSGGVDAYNNINSVFDAYNSEYAADLLRDGNVLYTRNGKNIQELLPLRRPVPKVTRSDVSSMNSVADASDVVNFSAKDPVEKKGHAACNPQPDGREAEEVPRAGRRAHAQHRGHAL